MRPAIALAALSLANCTSHSVQSGGMARVGIAETAYVDGPKVTPLALLEDSRCPAEVQCVWAGRVRISARVELGSGSQMHELTLGEPIQIADGALTLAEVRPEATSDRNIRPEEYRFGFTFAGGY